MMRQLSRAANRKVAELQLTIKMVDDEIQASSSASAIEALLELREDAQAELDAIVPPMTQITPPSLASGF
jgi:hypothetical protein